MKILYIFSLEVLPALYFRNSSVDFCKNLQRFMLRHFLKVFFHKFPYNFFPGIRVEISPKIPPEINPGIPSQILQENLWKVHSKFSAKIVRNCFWNSNRFFFFKKLQGFLRSFLKLFLLKFCLEDFLKIFQKILNKLLKGFFRKVWCGTKIHPNEPPQISTQIFSKNRWDSVRHFTRNSSKKNRSGYLHQLFYIFSRKFFTNFSRKFRNSFSRLF